MRARTEVKQNHMKLTMLIIVIYIYMVSRKGNQDDYF